jgi:hypothetical protein
MEMLKDINGKDSSKRIWANRILGVSLLMAVVWFIVIVGGVILGKTISIPFPYEMWFPLLGSGLASLGLTLWEQKK